MAKHIEKRRQGYYAILSVPHHLRPHFGRAKFRRTLKTSDEKVALRRAPQIVAAWRTEFARAEARNSGQPIEHPDADALFQMEAPSAAYRDTQLDEKPTGVSLGATKNEARSASLPREEAASKAAGPRVPTLKHLEPWLVSVAAHATKKTADQRRADVHILAERFKFLDQIKRQEIRELLQRLRRDSAQATVQRRLSGWKLYWRYLQDSGIVSDEWDPFHGTSLTRASARSTGKRSIARREFSPGQVEHLIQKAREAGDTTLATLIDLGRHTGARLEELCSLEVRDIDLEKRSLAIRKSKTESGVRTIPIHSVLLPTVRHLISHSEDGYLLSNLPEDKYGARSPALGKRFGRLKKDLGHGPERTFHSIRRTVATQLENAGVDEGITADILGHKKRTITYGLYSGGTQLDRMRDALERVTYPDAESPLFSSPPEPKEDEDRFPL